MKRRGFLHLGGSAAIAAASCTGAADPDRLPPLPTDTPSDRAAYAAGMLDLLCTRCGPRPAGSEGYDRAAEAVRRDLARSLAEVSADTWTFEAWAPGAPPVLTVGEEPVSGFYGIGCAATPPGGITGVLRQADNGDGRYDIVNPPTGEPRAHLSLSPRGSAERARSVTMFGLNPHCPPFVIVGTYARDILNEAVASGAPAALMAETVFTPDRPTSSIIGTITGQTADEVLLIAHLDTVYPSPGANDNAASLVIVLLLAHALAGTRPRRTLRFIASADEETGSHGMEHYIAHRAADGTVGAIAASINIDSATWGPNISITARDEATRRLFLDLDHDLRLPGRPAVAAGNIYTMDNQWFEPYPLVDALTVGSGGYDNIEYCWHRPDDIPSTVPLECVEIAYRLFREYLARTEGV